jgi:large subunit ribosomal protein L6
MSRIGKKPITVPGGVDVNVADGTIKIKGPGGELSLRYHGNMTVEHHGDSKTITVSRPNDERQNRALHGLTRALINNMVNGVVKPFEQRLEIVGVGYNAHIDGKVLQLQVGFANAVRLPIPPVVKVVTPDPTHIILTSADKQAVGQFAANIRSVRPPEPYKGKGVRYQDERVRRKAGKAFASK